MNIYELKYSNTNTYLIEGERGRILFDTGWAGTFCAFCRQLKKTGITVGNINFILISHFHPDHMGIAQEIASNGPVIAAADVQLLHMHDADGVFEKEGNKGFRPVDDENVKAVSIDDSRTFLEQLGILGQIFHTPGHSDDSISLWLDEGALFVGDLNPLYELDMHRDDEIGKSWDRLLKLEPKVIYYGHAKTAYPDRDLSPAPDDKDLYDLVRKIIRYIDKGVSLDRICKKTGADPAFAEDVARMYLTHQNIDVRGILDRIEIRGSQTSKMNRSN